MEKSTLLTNKTFLKAVSLGFVLGAGSQLIGSNAINFYLQTILESAKTNVPSEIASVIIGIIQVLASFSTTLIMNSFGRRTILLSSLVGILLGMVIIFFYIIKLMGRIFLLIFLVNFAGLVGHKRISFK